MDAVRLRFVRMLRLMCSPGVWNGIRASPNWFVTFTSTYEHRYENEPPLERGTQRGDRSAERGLRIDFTFACQTST